MRLLEPIDFNLNLEETSFFFVQDSGVFSYILGFRSFEFGSDISLKVVVDLCCGWHGYLVDGVMPELVLHELI